MDQYKIIAVRHNQFGSFTDFQLHNGQVINYQRAIEMGKRISLKVYR